MSKPEGVFVPEGTLVSGQTVRARGLINIVGRSGIGKSFLVRQLLEHPAFGFDEVYSLVSERFSLATYRHPCRHQQVYTFNDVRNRLAEFVRATSLKRRLPKVIVWDSLSGSGDRQREWFDSNPIVSGGGMRDKRAEYGELGTLGLNALTMAGNDIDAWVVVFTTSFERGGALPELALPGNMIPESLTRKSVATFYMKGKEFKYDPEEYPDPPQAVHRSYGRDEAGKLDGTAINRYLITMNHGEVEAKGFEGLNIREPANLPEILLKFEAALGEHPHGAGSQAETK